MHFSSLNADVLLHFMKFVKPVDRFNLVLSGILKGFENVKGIDLDKRIKDCRAELGLRGGSACELLEIRSLGIERPPDESLFKILERLAGEGYLQNNRHLSLEFDCSRSSRFVELICSMKNLESLNVYEHDLAPDVLAYVFKSCSKLIEMDIAIQEYKMYEMAEHLKIQLRSGFEKLRRLNLVFSIDDDTLPVIQEMLTWLKECVDLTIVNSNDEDRNVSSSLVTDGSLTFDLDFANKLQILKLRVPAALAKWILPVCLNIHTLTLYMDWETSNSIHDEIARLKKLKKLDVTVDEASDLKEIVRSCRQVEILRMDVMLLKQSDLAALEPAENTTDITLGWETDLSIEDHVLPIVKRWRHLKRLTFMESVQINVSVRSLKVICDFIMGMKHLSYLHIAPDYDYDGKLKVLREKVNEFILPRRPNFKFDITLFLD